MKFIFTFLLFSIPCFAQAPSVAPPAIPGPAPTVQVADTFSITRLELVFAENGQMAGTQLVLNLGAGVISTGTDTLRGENITLFLPFGSETVLNAKVGEIVIVLDQLVSQNQITVQQRNGIVTNLITLHNAILDFANSTIPLLANTTLIKLPDKTHRVKVN